MQIKSVFFYTFYIDIAGLGIIKAVLLPLLFILFVKIPQANEHHYWA